MSRQLSSVSQTLPPPIGGWNTRDPQEAMPPEDAIKLVNIFPDTGYCTLRGGYRVHSTSMGSSYVKTLHEYVGVDGTKKLIAFANNKIYNASSYGIAATDITAGSAITVDDWSTLQFRTSGNSYMVAVNGTDQPRSYDGTTVADLTITHASLSNDNNLIQVNAYKRRLYFVEKNTTREFYMPVDTLSGAASGLYDYGGVFRRGGYLLWSATWGRESPDGLQALKVVCSSMGEVLIYDGDDPSASNWSLVGHYFVGIPMGRKSFFFIDSELCIVTSGGIVPLSGVIAAGQNIAEIPSISDKIQSEVAYATANYSSNFGWQGMVYRKGKALFVNVPVVEGSRYDQFVQNIYTKAWCQYYGVPAVCWATFNEKPYFGGVDGKVYEFDVLQSDNGNYLQVDVKQAFNYLGDMEHIKRLDMAKPILQANESVSFYLGADVDYANEPVTTTVTTAGSTGSAWDSSDWDTTPWADDSSRSNRNWYNIQGLGYCFALKVRGQLKDTTFKWHATQVLYEPGGVL